MIASRGLAALVIKGRTLGEPAQLIQVGTAWRGVLATYRFDEDVNGVGKRFVKAHEIARLIFKRGHEIS